MFEATLRYNSNSDKHPIETSGEFLDSLITPGRMLAANAQALPSNLQNYADEYGIEYYIEPSLADFRVGTDFRDESNNLREWHTKYATQINDRLTSLLAEHRTVSAADLPDDDLKAFTKADVVFQENFVPNQLDEQRGKYEDLDQDAYRPKAVVPWFHKIQAESDLEVNSKILDAAREAATLPLKPCLFVEQEVLSYAENRRQLAKLLTVHGIDQCFVWVEGLAKHETDEDTYVWVAELVQTLTEEGIDPHFFYGDHFATVLSHLGATGTTYGTMYGEDAEEQRERRSGDGVATRYYLREVRDFVKIPAAVDIQQRVDADMCPCDVCQRQFDTWQDLAVRDQDDDQNIQTPMKKHHLRARWRQIQTVASEPLDETLERLDSDYRMYSPAHSVSNQVAGDKKLDYLQRWRYAIRTVQS